MWLLLLLLSSVVLVLPRSVCRWEAGIQIRQQGQASRQAITACAKLGWIWLAGYSRYTTAVCMCVMSGW